jgi:amidase
MTQLAWIDSGGVRATKSRCEEHPMAFELPSNDMVRRLGADLGMDISEEYAREFLEFAQVFVPDFRLVERLPDEPLPVKYPRTPGTRPEPADNPYNAWYMRTRIQGAATGKLAGKRLAIKDNVCVAGVPMMNGVSSILEGHVPDGDAMIVTRILDAGGEIVGKSVCEYFSFSGGSATSATGPVISPRNPGHTPGGSSTGSAALLVAGEVDLAIGADQAGSIRIPASFSGIVGLKPTFGLVPYTGIMGLDYGIDHAGPMARDVAGCALLLEVIAGEDGIDGRQRNVVVSPYTEALGQRIAGLRIGVVRESFGLPESHAGSDQAVRAALPVLQQLGAIVEEISIPWHRHGMPLWGALANEGAFHTLLGAHGVGRHGIGAYPLSLITALSGWRARQRAAAHAQGRHAARLPPGQAVPGSLLREGAEPAPAAAPRVRRGAGKVRPVADADPAIPNAADPVRRRIARRGAAAQLDHAREHLAVRPDGPPGDLGALRRNRRQAGRPDAGRPALRRNDGVARRACLGAALKSGCAQTPPACSIAATVSNLRRQRSLAAPARSAASMLRHAA